MEFYCFLLELRRYLALSVSDPACLRYYLNQIAPQLSGEAVLTDRRLINSLSRYPVKTWWPLEWGDPQIDPDICIHDGEYLHREAEILLEKLVVEHSIDLDTIPCSALQDVLANDAFVELRLLLVQKWTQTPEERESLENTYRWLRGIPARFPLIEAHDLQRSHIGTPYIDIRTMRRALYQQASDSQHLVYPDNSFVFCNRCGLRLPGDTSCTKLRCPGEDGWVRYPYSETLLILHLEHIARITIPAQAELTLYEQLSALVEPIGGKTVLWPAIDRFDIYVDTGSLRVAIDVKDWEHPEQLASEITGDLPNYAPYPYDLGMYVYPADRGGDYGRVLRERVQDRLVTNRIMNSESALKRIREAIE